MSHDHVPERFRHFIWPYPAIPFRLYFNSDHCRVFIIENLLHNAGWIFKHRAGLRKTDFFFVYLGCHYNINMVRHCDDMFRTLGLDKENFIIMFSDEQDQTIFEEYGFRGDIINHNAWLDYDTIVKPVDASRRFDAAYVARLTPFKRHELAARVPNLALVAGPNWGAPESPPPPHSYLNDRALSEPEVMEIVSASACGLLLSASEGACFSSSEYLLCGRPVVSTFAVGGRMIWYNDYNSIVVDANPEAVAEAVARLNRESRDREQIRRMHIQQSQRHRLRFVAALADVFRRCGVHNIDAGTYFRDTFVHKMRWSMTPDYDQLFSA